MMAGAILAGAGVAGAMMEGAVVEYMANALWQVPLLAGGAWMLLAAVKAGPRMQHGVWLAVLGLAVVLPLHGMGAGGVAPVRARYRVAAPSEGGYEAAGWREMAVERRMRREGAPGIMAALRPRGLEMPVVVSHWMVGLYVGAMMFGVCRVGWAWCAARRLVQESREVTLAGEQRVVLEDYGRRLRIRLPEVRESVEVSSPTIVGAAAPVLLLPARFWAHGREEIRAALLHELAHVKRRDFLSNALCELAGVPVFWHPVTHWVQARVRRTREMICDQMAAEEMRSELGYARCLLTLARGMLAGGRCEGHAGVGLFSQNVLEERMMRLMETAMREKAGTMRMRTKVVRAASGATAMAAATVMAAMFHVVPTLAASRVLQGGMEVAGMQAPVAPHVPAAPAAVPASPVAPQAPPAPAAPALPPHELAAPAAPAVAPVAPEAPPDLVKEPAKGKHQPCTGEWHRDEARSLALTDEVQRGWTAEQRRQMARTMADARRQMAAAKAKMESPEFKKQMADAQAQASRARLCVNSAEFKRQMEEARLSVEELKVEMPQVEIQLRDALAKVDCPELRVKIDDAEKIDMAEVQRKVDEAMRKANEELNRDVIK